MTINASPGLTANSFVDVAGADSYFSARLYSGKWDSAATEDKEKALKQATRMLDQIDWRGAKSLATNSLRWPRSAVTDRDNILLSADSIPVFLKSAACELAINFLDSDSTKTSNQDTALIKRVKAGPIDVEFAVADEADNNAIDGNVMLLISHYIASNEMRVLMT